MSRLTGWKRAFLAALGGAALWGFAPAQTTPQPLALAPRVTMDVLRRAHSLIAEDINGDGHLDIIITNTTHPTCCTYEGSTAGVFLNKGGGGFGPRQDLEAHGNPFLLLVRNLNGDGEADIMTANFIDQAPIQHRYLQAVHDLGLAPLSSNCRSRDLRC